MAKLIKTDGTIQEVVPANGKVFSLKEMQDFVGKGKDRMVEIVPLPSGKDIVVNEEGKLIGLETNEVATKIWKEEYPLEKYPLNNDELIVGDVLLVENLREID